MINIPTFKDTVTLYHQCKNEENPREAPRWSRTVIKGCYFGAETVKQVNGNTVSMGSGFICRIPKNEKNTALVLPGDIIAKGQITDEIADEAGRRPSEFLNKYIGISFTVKAVSDNTASPYAPHYRASGV